MQESYENQGNESENYEKPYNARNTLPHKKMKLN